MPSIRKYRRDTTEVSCCLKYVIFGVNVLFWFLGLIVLAVGIWAWTEKDTFSNLSRLTNIALDPAFIFICCGTITFIIGFTGCIGALRENTCLLACIKTQATTGFQTFITHYREDPDQQNLIDWIQEEWLQCCGVEGPRDWDRNAYFNCSSGVVGSREACGVPFSCCRTKPQDIIRNKQCGYDVRKPTYNYDIAKIIYEKGCLEAAEEWFDHNLLVVATSAVCTAFAQILGICFAQNLRADIFAQKSKWH
ncbi:tetraspanin-5 isoform X2 [Pieris brassicae]|uniref:tetraspanin-5 isoform X2 n=1 Tax=Pieris brassicae TaxID=7116 RepID=UPI001E661674|nr:tetraspanin-5 isoform X2 [Pieris brassicae]